MCVCVYNILNFWLQNNFKCVRCVNRTNHTFFPGAPTIIFCSICFAAAFFIEELYKYFYPNTTTCISRNKGILLQTSIIKFKKFTNTVLPTHTQVLKLRISIFKCHFILVMSFTGTFSCSRYSFRTTHCT